MPIRRIALPAAGAAGETFAASPIVQSCAEGETSWTEVAECQEAPAASPDVEADEHGNGLALAGLGTGVAGIVIGETALPRSRKA
jgi:periplasmic copper chaperone A